MFSHLVALATLLTISSAQTSIVTVFYPFNGIENIRGSIAGSDATATTFILTCAPDINSADCAIYRAAPATITAGPETLHVIASASVDDLTLSADCSLRGTTTGICTYSNGGSGLSTDSGLFIWTYAKENITLSQLIVTAGVRAAAISGSSVPATTTVGASASSSATVASSTASSLSTRSGGTTSTASVARSAASASASGTASAAASAAAASSLTDNVQWALAGALAALAFAA